MSGFLLVSAPFAALAGAVLLRIRRLQRSAAAARAAAAPGWGVDGGSARWGELPDRPREGAGSADGGAFPSRAALCRKNI